MNHDAAEAENKKKKLNSMLIDIDIANNDKEKQEATGNTLKGKKIVRRIL
jgi:hypothetical protein